MDMFLVVMLLAVGAMFLLTRRTRRQQKEAVAFRENLQPGDEVMTGSGLFGTVIEVDGDVITLESPSGARTDWLRAAIAKLASPPYAPAEEDGAEGEYEEGEYEEGEYEGEVEYEESAPSDEGAPSEESRGAYQDELEPEALDGKTAERRRATASPEDRDEPRNATPGS